MLSIKQLAFCQTMTFWFSLAIGGALLYMLLNTPDGTTRPGMYMVIWIYFAATIAFAIASAALANTLQKSIWVWGLVPMLLGPIGAVFTYVLLARAARV